MTPVPGSPPPPFRRAADITALRLGRAILGYLSAVMMIITLAPFRFDSHPVHGLTSIWDWSDIIMNIVMFVPIGFVYQLTRPAGARVPWWRVTLLGAALSGAIETLQLFEATRYTSLVDVATNTAGAVAGAWIYGVALRRIEGSSTVRTLALELPLMGLVYLLIPLMWLIGLASADSNRTWLTLLVIALASGVLGTVYTAYIAPARQLARGWLALAVGGWYVTSLLPGKIRDRDLLLTGLAIAIGVAWLRSLATSRDRDRDREGRRRFEIPTLRLLLPLFAAYLALSSLWPLDAAEPVWQGMWALLPSGDITNLEIYAALEHVGSFTLVGYIIAEFYGRDLADYRQIAGRVLLWGGGISVLLEIARGFHPAYHASALMVAFTLGAAMFGGWLYLLQRDHVRALLSRRTRTAPAAMPETNRSGHRDEAASASDPVEPVLAGL